MIEMIMGTMAWLYKIWKTRISSRFGISKKSTGRGVKKKMNLELHFSQRSCRKN